VRAEPPAIAESDALYDEHITLPMPNRIPQPGGFGLAPLRERAAVGEDLAERVADERFVKEDCHGRRLHGLERAAVVFTRHAQWHAIRVRIVDVISIAPSLLNSGRPRREPGRVGSLQTGSEVVEIRHCPDIPDA